MNRECEAVKLKVSASECGSPDLTPSLAKPEGDKFHWVLTFATSYALSALSLFPYALSLFPYAFEYFAKKWHGFKLKALIKLINKSPMKLFFICDHKRYSEYYC